MTPEATKKLLFINFVLLRRTARELVEANIFCHDEIRVLRRHKNKLKASGNPFDRSRIDWLTAEIKEISEEIKEMDQELADMGENLMIHCTVADKILSFTEKAQILGLSEMHLRKQCNDWEDKRLFSMIFACHAEYRGKEDIVDTLLLEAPLWGIASAWFFHLLKTNKKFSDTCSVGFDDLFPHLPKYQVITYSDGTSETKRMPPRLQLIQRGAGS